MRPRTSLQGWEVRGPTTHDELLAPGRDLSCRARRLLGRESDTKAGPCARGRPGRDTSLRPAPAPDCQMQHGTSLLSNAATVRPTTMWTAMWLPNSPPIPGQIPGHMRDMPVLAWMTENRGVPSSSLGLAIGQGPAVAGLYAVPRTPTGRCCGVRNRLGAHSSALGPCTTPWSRSPGGLAVIRSRYHHVRRRGCRVRRAAHRSRHVRGLASLPAHCARLGPTSRGAQRRRRDLRKLANEAPRRKRSSLARMGRARALGHGK